MSCEDEFVVPTGTVTFVLTDIEGSTSLWDRHPEAMELALEDHDRIVRGAIEAHGGRVFATGGDGFASVFAQADSAMEAAVEAQQGLAGMSGQDGLALRSRMGLHTGEAVERDGDYFGPALNRAGRVRDAANGSQILMTTTTADVVGHELPAEARLVDLGEHELRDVVEPVRLFRLDHELLPADRRLPRTGGARMGNLPATRDPLLGRDADVARLIDDLTPGGIVTVTGAGGIGKTRLALDVGHRLRPRWPDGVWMASLDHAERSDAMLELLLGLFGVEPGGDGGQIGSLVDGLRFRRSLLILDNCEHLVDAVAEVVDAIGSSCRDLAVLATSREALDVIGERVHRLRPLDTSADGPAIQLFFDRAEAAGAELDRAGDIPAVLEICRRVDGMPLAIELAGARARSLRPVEIVEQLDDMFRLLTAGRRQTAERHQTLRATIEWSYELLAEPEREVLIRLALFAGSFSLEAARAVAAADPDTPAEFIDVLDRLVAQSLVVPVAEADDSRFRLLEPVRQFAGERMVGRAGADRTRDAHARFFSDLMFDLGDRWWAGEDQATWPVAARDMANLRLAFDRMVENGAIDDAQRFSAAAFGPIVLHFDYTPEFDWAPRAVSIDREHVGPWTASACAVAAWGAMARGDTEGAASWVRLGASALAEGSVDDGLVPAAALHNVVFGGELAVNEEFLERSIETARESDDLARQVFVFAYTGHGKEALAAAEKLGNKVLVLLGRDAVWPSDEQARWDLLEGSWELAQESHCFIMRNMVAHKFGAFHVQFGTPSDGLLLLRTAARDWLLRGDTRVWDVLFSVTAGLAVLGDLDTAARLRHGIGDRHIGTVVSQYERDLLEDALSGHDADRALDPTPLDAGAAVELANRRIEELAVAPTASSGDPASEEIALTARQLEVAELVGRGLSNKEIARRLDISRYTVETHVRNILDRLDSTSRTQIATWVMARQPT